MIKCKLVLILVLVVIFNIFSSCNALENTTDSQYESVDLNEIQQEVVSILAESHINSSIYLDTNRNKICVEVYVGDYDDAKKILSNNYDKHIEIIKTELQITLTTDPFNDKYFVFYEILIISVVVFFLIFCCFYKMKKNNILKYVNGDENLVLFNKVELIIKDGVIEPNDTLYEKILIKIGEGDKHNFTIE